MTTLTMEDSEFIEKGACFPFSYLVDFLEFLHMHRHIVEIVTYNQFPWGDDYDYTNHYLKEKKAWQAGMKKKEWNPKKIYLIIQHDVDRVPERTIHILREEERLGIPSNVMIFNKRTNRGHFQRTGELVYTDYDLDETYLRYLQDEKGFEIGYHSNAFERAIFNDERAEAIFEEDIAILRQKYNITCFAPHGGARSPEGLTNNSQDVPDSLKHSIRWVNNKHTMRLDGNYSDGGIKNTKRRDPNKRDLRDFMRSWKRGERYRILLHPQYYNNSWFSDNPLKGTAWYDEMVDCYTNQNGKSFWNKVTIG